MIKFIKKKEMFLNRKYKKCNKIIRFLNLPKLNKIKIYCRYNNKKNKTFQYFINYGLFFTDLYFAK